jgi:hypothetical protein
MREKKEGAKQVLGRIAVQREEKQEQSEAGWTVLFVRWRLSSPHSVPSN